MSGKSFIALVLGLLAILPGLDAAAAGTVVIPSTTEWKYLDDGSDQADAWRGFDYDDSRWSVGAAELGYGDGDESTVVSYGADASNKHITTYFRRFFDVKSISQVKEFKMTLGYDDGAVVYINEAEVIRRNMTIGTITYRKRAQSSRKLTETYVLPKEMFREGRNLVAVEIHQVRRESTDISFWMQLETLGSEEDAAKKAAWPQRVLIVNDNGIRDPAIRHLAKQFSGSAEVTVVAALKNQSGSGSFRGLNSANDLFKVMEFDLGQGVRAYGIDGYPADCVVFALAALFEADSRPDLVISGVNDGANLGPHWFGSGTVGAARMAAHLGIPAVAVSGWRIGVKDDIESISRWVVRLAEAKVVADLEPGQYLTVSIPSVPFEKIRGVKITDRSGGAIECLPIFRPLAILDAESKITRWKYDSGPDCTPRVSAEEDIDAYRNGYIAIVPMNVHEFDSELQDKIQRQKKELPSLH